MKFFIRGRRVAGFSTLAVALVALALLTVRTEATTQATDRTIFVSAVGGNGMPIIDPMLVPAEFTVTEDGTAREVTKVDKAVEPVSFAVLYETSLCANSTSSASVKCEVGNTEANAANYVQTLREALSGFVNVVLTAAPPTSKILLMDFATAAVVKADFGSDLKVFEPILSRLVPLKSEPVLNEALLDVSRRMAKQQTPRRVILVVNREPTTEGSTSAQYNVVGDEVRKSGASVWALSVRYGTRQNGGRDQLLKALSANSGGLRITLGNVIQLGDYLRSVAANAIVQYAVTFKRPADAPPAKVTSVKTARTGVQPLTLQWSATVK